MSIWDWTNESEDPVCSLTLSDEYGIQVCLLFNFTKDLGPIRTMIFDKISARIYSTELRLVTCMFVPKVKVYKTVGF